MKRIGLAYWEAATPSAKIDYVSVATTMHNATFFDEFYFITNADLSNYGESIPDNLKFLDPKVFNDFIKSKWDFDLKPNFKSDILTYFGFEVLEAYGITDVDKIMELDTDYWLYNRLLVNNMFKSCKDTISIRDENEELQYTADSYFNCGAILVVKDSESLGILKQQLYEKIAPEMYYTEIGPRLTNSKLTRQHFLENPFSQITPHTLDKAMVDLGTLRIPRRNKALGIHLTVSMLKSIGFYIEQIYSEPGYIVVKYVEAPVSTDSSNVNNR